MNLVFIFPENQTQGFLADIDPRIKILTFLALIVAVIFTPSLQFLKFGLYFALLLVLIVGSRISLTPIVIRLLLVVSMMVFIGVVVFIFQRKPMTQNLMVLWNIFVKTIFVVISLSVLVQTTEFYRFIKALELLRVPRLFISLLGFTYRYLQLLFDETSTVKRAIDSRSFGKRSHFERAKILKSALFHVFLRTFARSEQIYAAMLSRGYEGSLSTMNFLFFKRTDFVFAAAIVTFLFVILVVI